MAEGSIMPPTRKIGMLTLLFILLAASRLNDWEKGSGLTNFSPKCRKINLKIGLLFL
jgi:hypothetical protein